MKNVPNQYIYARKDYLLQTFQNCPSIEGNTSILDYISKQLAESDRSFSVCFQNEGHYLQKYQAKFIANCTYSMLVAKNIIHRNVENGLKSLL